LAKLLSRNPAGAPSPLRSNTCWPSNSESRSSSSRMCWASRRFCSCPSPRCRSQPGGVHGRRAVVAGRT
jgi:hypothetical protein